MDARELVARWIKSKESIRFRLIETAQGDPAIVLENEKKTHALILELEDNGSIWPEVICPESAHKY